MLTVQEIAVKYGRTTSRIYTIINRARIKPVGTITKGRQQVRLYDEEDLVVSYLRKSDKHTVKMKPKPKGNYRCEYNFFNRDFLKSY